MKFGISFDFWNTLYGNGAENERAKKRKIFYYKIVNKYSEISMDSVEKAFTISTEYFIQQWRKKFRTPTTSERLNLMNETLQIQMLSEDAENIIHYFGQLIFEIPPTELTNLKQSVEELASRYSLGIISDTGYISGRYIRQFLKKENMLKYFSSCVFSDEQKNSKPHKSVFELTSNNLNVPISNLIHIGDLERTDIEGAANAGCKSVLYIGAPWENGKPTKADSVINDHCFLAGEIEKLVWKIINTQR